MPTGQVIFVSAQRGGSRFIRPAARTAWTFKAKLPPPGQPQRKFTEDDNNALLAGAEAHVPIRRAVDWLKPWVR